MQGVVERPQVGVHLLLQIPRQKTESFPRLHRRAGQNQSLHLAFREHPNRQNRGEKGLAGAGRTKSKGEVMTLHRVNIFFLSQRPGPQQIAGLTSRQNLLTHRSMVITSAGVEGPQRRLEINR